MHNKTYLPGTTYLVVAVVIELIIAALLLYLYA